LPSPSAPALYSLSYTTLFRSVLTVDSDSVADRRAIAEALRAFSVPSVQAVTALCLVRNRTAGLLTRLTDLETFTGTAVMRRARSDRKSTRLNSSHVSISYAVF